MLDNTALILVDIQKDFCPGGALAVAEGDLIIPLVNKISPLFSLVVATQDWHPANHSSFASNHPGKKPMDTILLNGQTQVLWPNHCVQGSPGAEFHPDLDLKPVRLIVRKGIHRQIDSYSTFLENDHKTETGLHYYLKGMGIDKIYLCGLATDYCVFFSALDALHFGFETTVLVDACKGVDFPAKNIQNALKTMQEKGIRLIHHDEL